MSEKAFLRGVGSVLNLFPMERNFEPNCFAPNILSDEEAFKKDLEQIGMDMSCAIKTIEQTYTISLENLKSAAILKLQNEIIE